MSPDPIMSPMSLLKCVECGGTVADSAANCPHCSTPHFKGLACRICGEVMRVSDKDSVRHQDLFYHRKCVSQIFADLPDYKCPECGKPRSGLVEDHLRGNSLFYERCRGCGAELRLVVGDCHGCGLAVLANHQWKRVTEKDGAETADWLYHTRCLVRAPAGRSRRRWLIILAVLAGALLLWAAWLLLSLFSS